MNETQATAKRIARRRLILLAIFFGLPLVLSWSWYFFASEWRPMGTSNHGQFVTPPHPITAHGPPLAIHTGKLSPHYFSHHWTLVYIGPPTCDADCKAVLYATRQVRLAVGKNIERVQRLYLVRGEPAKPRYLVRQHPDLTVVDASGPEGRALTQEFTDAVPASARIYLVDPLGNLMMSYSAHADANGLLADLKQLLKLSHVG